ncbi:MAG: hypothetical protein IH868_10565 [Chloroflexi bacterium]|nr:hypothetical protein [Chloroflexota bacterium]
MADDPATADVDQYRDVVIEATFQNPYAASVGPWDYGFLFNDRGFDGFESLFVTSDGEWFHNSRSTRDATSEIVVAEGLVPTDAIFRLLGDARNALRLIRTGDRAQLFINDTFVTELTIIGDAGSVWIGTGFLNGNEIVGRSTGYEDFQVSALDLVSTADELEIADIGDFIGEEPMGLSIVNSIAEAQFFNPYAITLGSWSYGFFIRSLDGGIFDAILIGSDSMWRHYRRFGSADTDILIASGDVSGIDTRAAGSNTIRVISIDDDAWLHINGRTVAILDFGGLARFGDVAPLARYFSDDGFDNSSTFLANLRIWEILAPQNSSTVSALPVSTAVPTATPVTLGPLPTATPITPTPTPTPTSKPVPTAIPSPTPAPVSTPSSKSGTFYLGSTKDQVRAVHGTPDGIAVSGNWWDYGSSYVTFSSGKVDGWQNRGELNLTSATVTAGTFSQGSTHAEVRAVQGNPDGIAVSGNWWDYGSSYVTFSSGKVDGWQDRGDLNLTP